MSENDTEQLEATILNEELELDLTQDDTEDVEALKTQIEAKNTFARQAVARAKRAEAELKALKDAKAPEATQLNNQPLDAEAIDTRLLKLQGKSDDDIKYLKKIASVNGTSLIEAVADDLYVSYEDKKQAQVKAEKARLGASKGGGSVKAEKTFNSQELSAEDHKALWRQQQG